MAVYTTLSESQVNELLFRYDLPALVTLRGASDGIENTTYFVELGDGRAFVLTLYERLSAEQLAPYVKLTQLLNRQQLPVPSPLDDQSGNAVQSLCNKPALLFPKIQGGHCSNPTAVHCTALGAFLARFHSAAENFSPSIPNHYGMDWLEQGIEQLSDDLSAEELSLLSQQIDQARAFSTQGLQRGIIHGDLFRDNALMNGDILNAVIDFNDAGEDYLLLDLAIVANDWCYIPPMEKTSETPCTSQPQQHCDALLEAYQSVRPLSDEEQRRWPQMLQWAAVRFWVSRLLAAKRAVAEGRIPPKDPQLYKDLLLDHMENEKQLQTVTK